MSWNHRILVTLQSNGDPYYSVHEVYYDVEGKPEGVTKHAITISGDNIKEIEWALNKIKKALEKPALWGNEKFPEEYKQ